MSEGGAGTSARSLRLVFAGTPEPAVPSLRALLASRHEVAAVVTRPDAPSGRGRHLHRSPVAEVADEHGVEVLQPAKASDPEFLGRLSEIGPDCCPVVAYGALLRPAALAIPRHGWVNLHFSLLPAWRGAAPVQHAVLRGDEVTGACTFEIEEGLDSGPVYGSVTESIGPRDTSGDLLARLAESGATLLVATIDAIADGTAKAVPQPADGVSLAPKITVADAEVRWSEPALAVDRRVRACTPAPGAWTTFRGQRLRLGPVEPATEVVADLTSGAAALSAGEVHAGKHEVLVGTATHPVRLGTVQPPGKRPVPAEDWARGARPEPAERLG
jgi:methionyl-tRNA formyltransferase